MICGNSSEIASSRASLVRALAERSSCLSLDQALRKHQLTRRLRAKAKKKESDQRKHQLEHSYRLQGVGGKWRRPGPCVAHDGNRCQYKSTTLPNRPLACRVKQLPLSKNHEYARKQNQQNAHVRVVPPSERECFIPRERRHPASREAVIRAKKNQDCLSWFGLSNCGVGVGQLLWAYCTQISVGAGVFTWAERDSPSFSSASS